MEFPILVQPLNKKQKFIINSIDELPFNTYFKIIRTKATGADIEIETDYELISVTYSKIGENDDTTQKNSETTGGDSSGD